jgi:hypothetical protein
MVTEVSWGATSPTTSREHCWRAWSTRPTINTVDTNNVFEDRGSLVGGLPVQQHAVCLYPSERDQRRDGHFEAEEVDELVHGLGQDAVGTKCDPTLLLDDKPRQP